MKGFIEGTTNITSGDRIKEYDSRRSKFKCKNYYNGVCKFEGKRSKDFPKRYTPTGEIKCIGSAHCKYYNEDIKNKITQIKVYPSYTFDVTNNERVY